MIEICKLKAATNELEIYEINENDYHYCIISFKHFIDEYFSIKLTKVKQKISLEDLALIVDKLNLSLVEPENFVIDEDSNYLITSLANNYSKPQNNYESRNEQSIINLKDEIEENCKNPAQIGKEHKKCKKGKEVNIMGKEDKKDSKNKEDLEDNMGNGVNMGNDDRMGKEDSMGKLINVDKEGKNSLYYCNLGCYFGEKNHVVESIKCYEKAINATSTKTAPWHIIPADDKKMCRYLVAKIIWEALQKLTDIKFPELSEDVKKNIEMYKQNLSK